MMLDARLNLARVEQHHAELSRVAGCVRNGGPEKDFGRCAEPAVARGFGMRRRRPSLRLGFVAGLWRG
jgi:hypothetical protein